MKTDCPTVDLAQPEVWREPAGLIAGWFEQPVRAGRIASTGGLMLFRHADVQAALCDTTLGAMGTRAFDQIGWTEGPFVDWMRHNVVALDPPDHTRLRSLVSRVFTPRRVAQMAPQVYQAAHELADQIADDREVDFYKTFAQRLPLTIICSMLGIPEVDHGQMQRWTEAINTATGIPRVSARSAADDAIQSMGLYVNGLTEERRQSPRQDLLTALVESHDQGERLSAVELPAMVIQILVAGHETTRNLIGNGLFTLVQHPDQMNDLRNNPSLIENAVEEMIRFEPPLIWVARLAKQPAKLAGEGVGTGELILLNLAAANRDPEVHKEPQNFDVRRKSIRALSFGMGAHFCIGASLARLEARIAFEVLLTRFSQIDFFGPKPQFAAYTALRTLEELSLRFTAA
ncbi:MAG: cytochrome P450 [Myxococcota bacterium]|nr:cytochrome P450 [Myxococcota bacterium]